MNATLAAARNNAVAIAIAASLGACAIDPAPTDDLARARTTLREASRDTGGAVATRELALAGEKIALAERWMAAGDQRPARWLVEQAQVDAELAAMKEASSRARMRAAALTEQFRAFNVAAHRVSP